jgi:hypothetical protein
MPPLVTLIIHSLFEGVVGEEKEERKKEVTTWWVWVTVVVERESE